MNYPTTKAEWLAFLEEIEEQLEQQGAVVDARLLKKRDDVREIINTWEETE
jgi:hypothetical protein